MMPNLGVLMLFLLGLEIFSIIVVVKWVGLFAALFLMILSFMCGSYLLRGKGNMAQILISGALLRRSSGKLSFYQLLESVHMPLAGLLLMIPGFFSTLIAILLILLFQGKGKSTKSDNNSFYYQNNTRSKQADDDIIEGEFVVKDKPIQNNQQIKK